MIQFNMPWKFGFPLKHNPNTNLGEVFMWVGLNAMLQSCLLSLFLIPLSSSNHRCSWLLKITHHVQNTLGNSNWFSYNNIYNEKNFKELILVQNVPNASNILNFYFFKVKISTLYLQLSFTHILKILFKNVSYGMIYWGKTIFMGFTDVRWQQWLNEHVHNLHPFQFNL